MKKKGNSYKKSKKKWDHHGERIFMINPCIVCSKQLWNDSSFVKMCKANEIPNYKTYCYDCYRKS